MKKISLILIAVVLALTASVWSQQLVPFSHAVVTVNGSASGRLPDNMTVTNNAGVFVTRCEFAVETSDIRIRYDGPEPTSTTGQIWANGGIYFLNGSAAIRQWQAILRSNESSAAMVTIDCWK